MTNLSPNDATLASQSREDPDRAAALLDAIRKGQDDLRRLLAFAARSEGKVDAEVLKECAEIVARDPQSLVASEQPWAALKKLGAAVQPVSAASVSIAPERRDRIVRNSQRWVVGALVVTLVVQIAAIFLAIPLNDIAELKAKLHKDQQAYFDTLGKDFSQLTAEQKVVVVSMNNAIAALQANYQMIDFLASEGRDRNADPQAVLSSSPIAERLAQGMLEALSIYLLPVLYGFLGACSYILRRVANQVANTTLTEVSSVSHHLRRILGAAAGGTIGLFYQAGATTGQPTLSLVAVAFLCGYSVELVFTILDSWIQRVRSIFAAPTAGSTQPAPPAG